jgi:hypothetical protein
MILGVIVSHIVEIVVVGHTVIMSVIHRIISPIVWRIPPYVRRAPKPTVNDWSVNIYRLDNITSSINIWVAYYLYYRLITFFRHDDSSYILVYIFR